MIKRTYLLTILLIVCLLTGCGNKTEKMCRIEIRNENSTDVITLEQQSQADVDDFFDEDEWTECENFDEKLVSAQNAMRADLAKTTIAELLKGIK